MGKGEQLVQRPSGRGHKAFKEPKAAQEGGRRMEVGEVDRGWTRQNLIGSVKDCLYHKSNGKPQKILRKTGGSALIKFAC